MLNAVVIEKEKYVSIEKAALLRAFVMDPQQVVLKQQVSAVNDFVMQLALNRK